jgi:dTDP-4-amino-4,6-dideoxygalactose transaminase/ribosomal protein S18 acetylase RimI-like enzyme
MADAINAFEHAFAQWLGVRRAFAFWKGRVAMYAILRGLGVGEGDEVILPGYTCVMDVNPIMYLGARPAFVDIEPVTYNMDVDLLEAAITPRTKVIVAQHTYGFPCRMDRIMEIAARHNIPVVEDCCLALGSTYRGKRCGTFGVAAYWSFQWNKPFTTGIGGMATTDDAALAARIDAVCREALRPPSSKAAWMLAAQRLVYRTAIFPRTTAFATMLFRWLTRKGAVVGSSDTCEFSPAMPEGFFTGISAGQARAGLRQMGRIEKNLAHRRSMRAVYDDLLRQAGWPVADLPQDMDPVLVRYPVRVADKARAVAEAPKHLVELGTWFECPLHPIETPLEQYGYHAGMCPVAEKACREVVNLPTHMRAGEATARRSVRLAGRIGPPADAVRVLAEKPDTADGPGLRVVQLRPDHVAGVVDVHMRAFEAFFLTFLGPKFLAEFYRSFTEDAAGVGVVAEERGTGRVLGAVVGPLVPGGYFKRLLKRRWWAFCMASARAVLRRPSVAGRLVRAVFYRGESPHEGPERALLSSICVDPAAQGGGVGRAMVEAWLGEVRRRGGPGAFLTTDAEGNEAVNAFYQRLGWRLESTFTRPEGRVMNRYVRDFAEASPDGNA